MKLFLASLASITLDLILPLLPDKPSNLKLAFIKTAADPYGDIDMPWLEADWKKLNDMGFAISNYDLKNKNLVSLQNDLSDFQIIFMSGGNTYYLLNEIRKSNFDMFLTEFLNHGGVYIGASAGSSIASPTIRQLTEIDHPEVVPELTDYTGLNLVKEIIVPHHGQEKYKARHDKLKLDWGDKLLFLQDNQALYVDGDNIVLKTNHDK